MVKNFLTLVLNLLLFCNCLGQNFIVNGNISQQQKIQLGQIAERERSEIAIKWFGKELDDWVNPVPIHVTQRLIGGSGGSTSFIPNKSISISVEGKYTDILISTVPHEVCHAVMNTYYRKYIPLWVNEGMACMEEPANDRNQLRRFIKVIIPFREVMSLEEYPHPTLIMNFYGQSYVMVEWFVALKGRETFLKFVGELDGSNSEACVRKYYGFNTLDEAQREWLR